MKESPAIPKEFFDKFDNDIFATLDDLVVTIRLGKGAYSEARLAFYINKPLNEQIGVVVKFHVISNHPLEGSLYNQLQNESQTLSLIHANEYTTRLKQPAIKSKMYKVKENQTVNVEYLVFDYINCSELFDYVKHTGPFSEQLTRYFFHKFMEGLKFLHNDAGFVHRDIKLENLILDINCKLIFIDFGCASPIKGYHEGKFNDKMGTRYYMAPEIHEVSESKQYYGVIADIFAAGVALFTMLVGSPPFRIANEKDLFYKYFIGNKPDQFWNAIQKSYNINPNDISNEFKDLLNQMLAFNPGQRPSIETIMQSAWYKGPVPSYEQIKEEFKNRLNYLEEKRHKEEEDQRQIQNPISSNVGGHHLGMGETIGSELDNRIVKNFIQIPGKFTYKGLNMDPQLIFSQIIEFVNMRNGNYNINPQYMEGSFNYITVEGDNLEFFVEVRKGPTLNYLYIDRIEGHPCDFIKEYEEIIKMFVEH